MDGDSRLLWFLSVVKGHSQPIPRSRGSCYLLNKEGSQEQSEAFMQGRRIVVFRRWHTQCLEDGTAEQVKLVDCLIFLETMLQMGFQSETYYADSRVFI